MKTKPPEVLVKTSKKVTVLFGELKAARTANAPAQQLATAQFYLDFVEAGNSFGFHAPQEAFRILGESINFARKGQLALRPAK